jgi:hypothetical protein
MPSGQNWIYFLYVNIAFAIYIAGVFYFNQIAEIKSKWPLYRCNPMYTVLADDVEENFAYCAKNMQNSYLNYLLQKIAFIISSLTATIAGFMVDVQNIPDILYKIRNFTRLAFNNISNVNTI